MIKHGEREVAFMKASGIPYYSLFSVFYYKLLLYK